LTSAPRRAAPPIGQARLVARQLLRACVLRDGRAGGRVRHAVAAQVVPVPARARCQVVRARAHYSRVAAWRIIAAWQIIAAWPCGEL
jgi:hypothetical protein